MFFRIECLANLRVHNGKIGNFIMVTFANYPIPVGPTTTGSVPVHNIKLANSLIVTGNQEIDNGKIGVFARKVENTTKQMHARIFIYDSISKIAQL